jgi:2-polyprenyl-3-methyl-5-hydroxy-6-metoxy-1,4-benzoquinol methylase
VKLDDAIIPRCNLCSRSDFATLFRLNGFTIAKCRQCKLIAVTNPPSLEELVKYYDDAYYNGGDAHVYYNYLAGENARRKDFLCRLHDLARYVSKPGSLIEVGSAYGLFLDVARQQGWKARGVELSPTSSEYARCHLGLDVVTGDLSVVSMSEPYDAAVGWDVIEHLVNPMETLIRINTHLRMGGIIAFSTGNAACAGVFVYGRRWHLYAPPWHLFYFTPTTLTSMLEIAGFSVINITHQGNPFYNPSRTSLAHKLIQRCFCNSRIDHYVCRAATRLKQGLAFTVIAQKVNVLPAKMGAPNKPRRSGSRIG